MMSSLDAADREVKRRVIAGATLILTLAFTIPLIARATGGASPVRTPLAALAPLAALVALAATALASAGSYRHAGAAGRSENRPQRPGRLAQKALSCGFSP
jgi:hypothetical protein